MNAEKIQMCREHLESLPLHVQEWSKTAKHLICAVDIAERLLIENNRLEMENREYRIKFPRFTPARGRQ